MELVPLGQRWLKPKWAHEVERPRAGYPETSSWNGKAIMSPEDQRAAADKAIDDLLAYYRRTAPLEVSILAERAPDRRREAIAILSYQLQMLTRLVEVLIHQNGLSTGGAVIADPEEPKAAH